MLQIYTGTSGQNIGPCLLGCVIWVLLRMNGFHYQTHGYSLLQIEELSFRCRSTVQKAMLIYPESQQGYYSVTNPTAFSGEDVKGKPVNGKGEYNYPHLTYLPDGQLKVVKSPKQDYMSVKEYLSH